MSVDWEAQIERYWERVDRARPEAALHDMRELVRLRPQHDPEARFELASVHDFLGQEREAIPLYEAALSDGLAGSRRSQAVIQLASSLRNVGRPADAAQVLMDHPVDENTRSAAQAFLSLVLHDEGNHEAALQLALLALAPTLPLYGAAIERYARALTEHHTLKIRPIHGTEEYPRLVEIWRSAVKATHTFLSDSDFIRIETQLAPVYFPAVKLLVAERNGKVIGFAGVSGALGTSEASVTSNASGASGASEDAGEPAASNAAETPEPHLEMLFVDDEARGSGVGTALLREAIRQYGVRRVDVNEQNPQALGFYLQQGFTEFGRSELDGDGMPYPILHLTLKS